MNKKQIINMINNIEKNVLVYKDTNFLSENNLFIDNDDDTELILSNPVVIIYYDKINKTFSYCPITDSFINVTWDKNKIIAYFLNLDDKTIEIFSKKN